MPAPSPGAVITRRGPYQCQAIIRRKGYDTQTKTFEFYAERSEAELADAPWELVGELVRSQVRSQLGVRGVTSGTTPDIARQLAAWLQGLGAESIQVVYDYGADFGFVEELQKHVAASVWSMLVPIHVGYLLEDVDGAEAADAEWARIGVERGLHRHHALADARALRARFHAVHRE